MASVLQRLSEGAELRNPHRLTLTVSHNSDAWGWSFSRGHIQDSAAPFWSRVILVAERGEIHIELRDGKGLRYFYPGLGRNTAPG